MKIARNILLLLDDVLYLLGCGCVVYGISLWNIAAAWIAAGIALISLGVMYGKAKANAYQQPVSEQ
jgi:hypothetical protein